MTDPFDLEVHRAVQAGDAAAGAAGAAGVRAARARPGNWRSWCGRRPTGRAGSRCWWAGPRRVRRGRAGRRWDCCGTRIRRWRLWHPIDPSRPEAALRELPSVGPRTVVWLNEAQLYLDVAADGLGERVAAGLRELLRDPARGPVLVLATLWPEFWDRLTARPPGRARIRMRRPGSCWPAGTSPCPPRSPPPRSGSWRRPVTRGWPWPPRRRRTGRSPSSWPGAPELMARYRNAPPAAAALITAAIDARRLGMGIALPLAFLEAAAPGYLTDADWDALGEDWLEQALAYTAAPAKGIRGPLSRIRPRAAGSATRPPARVGLPAGGLPRAARPPRPPAVTFPRPASGQRRPASPPPATCPPSPQPPRPAACTVTQPGSASTPPPRATPAKQPLSSSGWHSSAPALI